MSVVQGPSLEQYLALGLALSPPDWLQPAQMVCVCVCEREQREGGGGGVRFTFVSYFSLASGVNWKAV